MTLIFRLQSFTTSVDRSLKFQPPKNGFLVRLTIYSKLLGDFKLAPSCLHTHLLTPLLSSSASPARANHHLPASLTACPHSLGGCDLIRVQHTLAPTPCLVQRVGLVPPPQLPQLPQFPHPSPGQTCWVVSVTSRAPMASPNSWQHWRHCAAWRHHLRRPHRHGRSCRSPSWRPR